jgi:hypothetical protein
MLLALQSEITDLLEEPFAIESTPENKDLSDFLNNGLKGDFNWSRMYFRKCADTPDKCD